MTGKNPEKDSAEQDSPGDAMEHQIQRTIAEAEAAVEAIQSDAAVGPDDEPPDSEATDEETAEELEGEAEIEIEGPSEDDELERAHAECAALKDKWLRSVADLENFKKRVKRDQEDAITRATQELLSSFLPTVDNLDRALEAAGPDAPEQLVKGIVMVRDEFLAALARNGIEPVPSVGQPFDPAVHDALQQMDSEEHPPGTVTREFEKGYRRGERLLRPARVIVAGAGSTGGGEEDE
jgi:molecular chaperone GrpE